MYISVNESPSLLPVQQFSPAVASVDHTAEPLPPQPSLPASLCTTYLKTPALPTCSKSPCKAYYQALTFAESSSVGCKTKTNNHYFNTVIKIILI